MLEFGRYYASVIGTGCSACAERWFYDEKRLGTMVALLIAGTGIAACGLSYTDVDHEPCSKSAGKRK
jgi:hypothetical protein